MVNKACLVRKAALTSVAALVVYAAVGSLSGAAAQDEVVVRATLFYRPECGHCHHVMTEVLPPLTDRYGDQFVVEYTDIETTAGHARFEEVMAESGLPRASWGVPVLVLGDEILIGSLQIPDRLPGLIEDALSDVDGGGSLLDVIGRDMPGNAIGLAMLCGMVLAVGHVMVRGRRVLRRAGGGRRQRARARRAMREQAGWRRWAVPALCLLGVAVSAYLTYVEVAQVEAVCGPVGHCNAVQQSDYAYLFGAIPVAAVGVAGYLALLAAWALGRAKAGRPAELAPALLLCLAGFGTLFSIFLTSLAVFVVGASCLWCLLSSLAITLILLFSADSGLERLRQEIGARRRKR